jgi:alpha-1,2-mannosyltransferase
MATGLRRRPKANDRAESGRKRSGSKPNQSDVRPVSFASPASFTSRYRGLPGWTPNPVSAVALLFCIRITAGLTNSIADCDETFNYWEPLHMILHGSGLQTWEYSPDFALRSYLFLLPYAAIAQLGTVLAGILSISSGVGAKMFQFYFVRVVQAVLCAIAEFCLYDSCVYRFGKSSARLFLLFLLSSPGMFRSASELLPSSFAMILIMFAFSNWFVGRFNLAVVFVAIAACVGWPFVALLAVPLALHVSFRRGILMFLYVSFICGALLVAVLASVDSAFYGKLVLAPLNIIRYNVFPVPGSGPDLYGVEPWTFYLTNLLLNCNVSIFLFLFAPFLWFVTHLFVKYDRDAPGVGPLLMARLIFLSPAFIWLAVFWRQPHKEERFLAPVYPMIAMVAAVALSDASALFLGERTFPPRDALEMKRFPLVPRVLKTLVQGSFVVASIGLGASRVYMQVHSFRAPLSLFNSFSRLELQEGLGPRHSPIEFASDLRNITVCVGEEWYRFPSHFFLPGKRFRLRFVRSSFSGLLPKAFDENGMGTRNSPPGMNMLNREDRNQYVGNALLQCHYLVDLDLTHRAGGTRSQVVSLDIPDKWLTLFSEQLLDLRASPVFFRSFWIPGETIARVKYAKLELRRNLDLLPITHQ